MSERIQRMEAAMVASGLGAKDIPLDPLPETVDIQTDLSDRLSTLMGNASSGSIFIGIYGSGLWYSLLALTHIGSSSGFSIFSPQGIRWVTEKTGDVDFARVVQFSHQAIQKSISSTSVTSMWNPLQEKDRMPLPEIETGKLYIKCKCRQRMWCGIQY